MLDQTARMFCSSMLNIIHEAIMYITEVETKYWLKSNFEVLKCFNI